MAYATVNDIKKVAEVTDESRAVALLDRASNMLDIEFERCGIDVDSQTPAWYAYLVDVCVNMVVRAMPSEGVGGDYTQMSMTAGSYSQSYSNADGIGGLRPTPDERRNLGIEKKKGRVGFAQLGGSDD